MKDRKNKKTEERNTRS